MNRLPEQNRPLPLVASSLAWTWRYFRFRYLPTAASMLVVIAVVSLWSMNLPQFADAGASASVSTQAGEIAEAQLHMVGPTSPGEADAEIILTNGNPVFWGRLVDKD